MAPTVISLFIILSIVAIGVWMVIQRGKEVGKLAEHGRSGVGRVTGRQAHHRKGTTGRSRRVQISYDHEGTTHARWIQVTTAEWEAYTEGAEVPIVYLPDSPSVFATRDLVNHARAARSQQPLA